MPLVDMKRPKSKRAGRTMSAPVVEQYYEKYPYGLRINLDTEDFKKLGTQADSMKVGGLVRIVAIAEVTELRVSDRIEKEPGGGENTSATLQIQKLAIMSEKTKGDNSLKAIKQRIKGNI